MKLATLVSSYEKSSSPFGALDCYPDPSAWVPEHRWERVLIDKVAAARQVREQSHRGFDAFVCLCDGTRDEDTAGVEVVVELETLGLAYTGAGPEFFDPSRLAQKDACTTVGVDTPRHVFAHGEAEASWAADHLRFPLLVKHPNSYGSLGLVPADRVERPAELWPRVASKVAEFGGALIEEFVEGSEYSVLVAEPAGGNGQPRSWMPVEVVFPPGETFKHFNLKWMDHEQFSTVPVTDAALRERLQHAAGQVFLGLDGTGYARIDLRMDAEGRIFVLDVNPNPGIFYPPGQLATADFILSQSPGGHRGFLQYILDRAFARQARQRP